MVYRLQVVGVGVCGQEAMQANVDHVLSLGLPVVEKKQPNGRPLAIVGGGHSAKQALEELRNWPGDIWAINGTCQWLLSQGVEATLLSVDPEDCLAPLCVGVKKALLATHCSPQAFTELKDADVQIFSTRHVDFADPIGGGTTTATRAPLLALRLGYTDVSYFGCEGNFGETSHVFKAEEPASQVIVKAGGKDYRANLQFLNQSENLAEVIRNFPAIFKDRSGGLLGAMLANPDTWEVVALSEELFKVLTKEQPECVPA